MTAAQQQHYDRIVAAGVTPVELSETARLVLRWLAAGDHTVCDRLVELLERAHDAGFEQAGDLALYPGGGYVAWDRGSVSSPWLGYGLPWRGECMVVWT